MPERDEGTELAEMRRELVTIRRLLSEVLNAIREAEAEIPEKMRRFTMYMHDIHDITYLYEQRGHQMPVWLNHELQRCDDRFRQLLEEQHLSDGTFAKVRAEMAKDKRNRWDHAKQLAHFKPEEKSDATGSSERNGNEKPEGGTEIKGG